MRLLLAFLSAFASGFVKGLWKVASGLIGLARKHPSPTASAAALALAWWQWSAKHDALDARDKALASLSTEKNSREAERAGWQRQVADAKAATAAAERKSQENASHAQTSHDALAADNAGLRDYIASRRLRAETDIPVATRTTDDLGASVHAGTAAVAIVATDETDILSCDSAYVYAASAYQWSQGLIAAGLARPDQASKDFADGKPSVSSSSNMRLKNASNSASSLGHP